MTTQFRVTCFSAEKIHHWYTSWLMWIWKLSIQIIIHILKSWRKKNSRKRVNVHNYTLHWMRNCKWRIIDHESALPSRYFYGEVIKGSHQKCFAENRMSLVVILFPEPVHFVAMAKQTNILNMTENALKWKEDYRNGDHRNGDYKHGAFTA